MALANKKQQSMKRCINYHHYTGSKCEACVLKHERKNAAQIKPLTEQEKVNLREHCKNVLKEEGIKHESTNSL